MNRYLITYRGAIEVSARTQDEAIDKVEIPSEAEIVTIEEIQPDSTDVDDHWVYD